jgi:hypothetical protein
MSLSDYERRYWKELESHTRPVAPSGADAPQRRQPGLWLSPVIGEP